MPNVCVEAYTNGTIQPHVVREWPPMEFIQKIVGGLFVEVPTRFTLSFDDWEENTGVQNTVVYCNETARLRNLPINRSPIAMIINKRLGDNAPLLGNLLIVSGNAKFTALQK